jgi:hypothetical protein
MSKSIINQSVTEAYVPSTVLAGAIGNVVEWYDWTVYGLLAGVFSHSIFPADNPRFCPRNRGLQALKAASAAI